MDKLYRNCKNGNVYKIIGNAINCTNDRDGEKMVIYSPVGSFKTYVRKEKEFFEKFKVIE
ncbi:DUF1653 domain-containing protein [Candidatus Dojkabacteria bacterium]|jgi:hypothetical protein|nr:DUF1653 domain-containing protein [Candidatus Dojkabacteria bacterium]